MAKLSPESIAKLKQVVSASLETLKECETLKEGMTDTVKDVADELEVKPAIIHRLIRDIHKNRTMDRREDHETLEELYKAAGLG